LPGAARGQEQKSAGLLLFASSGISSEPFGFLFGKALRRKFVQISAFARHGLWVKSQQHDHLRHWCGATLRIVPSPANKIIL
jgi:hypothetical protein